MNKPFSKWIFFLLFITILIGGSVFVFAGDKEEEKNKLKTVNFTEVSKAGLVNVKDFSGYVRGENEVMLAPKISGRLIEIKKEEGDFVKKGEVLAIIDGDEIAANLESANNSLEAAEENLDQTEDYYEELEDQAQDNYDRAKDNYEKIKIDPNSSQEEIEKAKVSKKEAKANLESAEELAELQEEMAEAGVVEAEGGVNVAKSNYNDTVLRAPFDGIITDKFLDKGSLVSPNNPLFKVSSQGNRFVYVYLDKSESNLIKKDDSVSVENDQKSCEGTVVLISENVKEVSYKKLVKIKIGETCNYSFGELVSVNFDLEKKSNVVTIQLSSVVKFYYDNTVFVLNENEGIWTVEQRKIKLGLIEGERVEVIEGINEGEKIVTQGQFYLNDNEQVDVK